MRASAEADYAVRAAVELAPAPPDQPIKGDAIAEHARRRGRWRAAGIPGELAEHPESAVDR